MNTTFMSSKILVTFPSKKVRIALVVHYLKNSWLTKMLSKPLTGDLILKWENEDELSTDNNDSPNNNTVLPKGTILINKKLLM